MRVERTGYQKRENSRGGFRDENGRSEARGNILWRRRQMKGVVLIRVFGFRQGDSD